MSGLVGLAAASAVLAWLSRKSLFDPRSHGFYRFFAWESILALFVVNARAWFRDPFSWHQLVSWGLLVVSLVPLTLGVTALKSRGRAAKSRAGEPGLLGFESTTSLVDTGVYRLIRHPMYSSLLLLAWGIFFKVPDWPGAALALSATAFLFATALADEAECVRYFGPAYRSYMARTTRFVPFLF